MFFRRTLAFALVGSIGLGGALAACDDGGEGLGASPDAAVDATAPDAQVADGGADGGSAVRVRIVAFNDFHGNLEPPSGSSGAVLVPIGDPLVGTLGADAGVKLDSDAGVASVPAGGAAFLAAHVARLRAEAPNTLVVSAGDLTGASPLVSNVFRDEPSVLVMNALGLDFNGVGNHEFDRGLAELLRLTKPGCTLGDCDGGAFAGAKFTYLAANVVEEASSAAILPRYGIRTFGSAKVAVVGMTLEGTPDVTVASNVKGLRFEDEVTTVNALVPTLKAEGAAAIVVVVHQGGFQGAAGTYDSCTQMSGDILAITAALDPAVDAVVSGHTHQAYDCNVGGRLLTSAASFGRVVTAIDLDIDPTAKKVVSKTAKNHVVTRNVAPDPAVAAIVADYRGRSATVSQTIVGHVTADLAANAIAIGSASCETPLGDVIADAQLAATSSPEAGGAVVAFMNPGGIRADVVYAPSGNESPGAVTYGEAFTVQPFSNNLVTMTLTGAQIKAILTAQLSQSPPRILSVSTGFSYAYNYDAVAKTGAIVPDSVKLGGVAIDDGTPYRVTANAFLAGGGDKFTPFASGTGRVSGKVDLDALLDHLAKNDPLAPPALDRISGNACQP